MAVIDGEIKATPDQTPADGETPPVEGEPQAEGAEAEVDVVLASDEGSPPQNVGFRRRVNKLNQRNAVSQEKASEAENQLAVVQEQNRLYRIALDQRDTQKAPKPPDPDDFDDGAGDPKYAAALQAHTQAIVDARIDHRASQPPQGAPQPGADPNIVRLQEAHYDRAAKLGVKDYEDAEDALIEILGAENVRHIIQSTAKSELLTYHLGKNPDKARYFADFIKREPVAAVMELGELSAGLSVQPKTPQPLAPDPDKDLEGGIAPTPDAYERQLDKLRDTGNMQAIMEFKRKHKARATA